jgi:hypothetical protein
MTLSQPVSVTQKCKFELCKFLLCGFICIPYHFILPVSIYFSKQVFHQYRNKRKEEKCRSRKRETRRRRLRKNEKLEQDRIMRRSGKVNVNKIQGVGLKG